MGKEPKIYSEIQIENVSFAHHHFFLLHILVGLLLSATNPREKIIWPRVATCLCLSNTNPSTKTNKQTFEREKEKPLNMDA